MKKKQFKQIMGFSLAEAMITLLIVCIIAIASAPVITKRHKLRTNLPHGAYACYWNGGTLVAKYIINGTVSDGKVVYDGQEGRYGCEFNPPPNSKSFVATILGGGGGGAGAGTVLNDSSVIRTFPEIGDYTYTTPESGLYKILAVGGGGGGGGMWGSRPQKMAGTGSAGGLVYTPYTFIGKGTQLSIKVGKGGNGAWDGMGGNGEDTYVKDSKTGVNYALAGGGGGGAGWRIDWNMWPNPMKRCDDANFIVGYPSGMITSFPIMWSKNGLNNVEICQGNYKSIFNTVVSGSGGSAGSDIKGAVTKTGKRLGVLSSADHQNHKDGYNMIPNLTDYNGVFGFDFNIVEKHPTNRARNMMPCRNYALWVKERKCKLYSNHYGSGGGAEGDNDDRYYEANNGTQGFAALKYVPLYAGLGGESGKVAQIPYAEMPAKTLLFPGKGGKGGTPSTNLKSYNAGTAGTKGETSYIKNGAQIYGGAGASKIVPGDEKTYSTEKNDDNLPTGGDGELSDVLTSKKIGTGGLGGLHGENTTIDGLTQTVFENGAQISGFNKIFGAGSGGGGGTASVNNAGGIIYGSGGRGTSGLVFIQW